MRTLLTVASVAALLAAPAFAASPLLKTPTPKVIDGGAKLTWALKPDSDKIKALADDDGARHGSATVECTINGAGRPKDCTVVAEDGNNFGAFVKDLAAQFKAASKDVDGKPSQGRKVRLTYTMEAAALHP